MSDEVRNREDILLDEAALKGPLGKAAIYSRLSGPGWLQGAVTLGGGSLAGALYLGVILGYEMMWLQPIAMVLGVIMLSAISYVTLSTGERPFRTLKHNISPSLAWGWLIATIMANIVWCLPQFALGTAAVEQNLIPSMKEMGTLYESELITIGTGKAIIAGTILAIASVVVWFYNSGSKGIKLFEMILKIMVGIVVLSFFGVVAAMTFKGALDWGHIFNGFIPNLTYLFEPAPALAGTIENAGTYSDWWKTVVADTQKDKIIAAFATAVGINMTFLLPYSMLRKGWGKKHRGLATFDLSLGLIIPFVLATGCVVIATASQFHGKTNDILGAIEAGQTDAKEIGAYYGYVDKRLKEEHGSDDDFTKMMASIKDPNTADHAAAVTKRAAMRNALPLADKEVSAMLAGRDNFALAKTLEPLVGAGVAQTLFGVGVLGMAISTIIILMVINGFAICELFNVPPDSAMHRVGSFLPAVGVVGPFIWGKAAPALAIPTSVIGGAMLPIAYFSFLLLMNSRRALGDSMPTGLSRVIWNVLMVTATVISGFASAWGLYSKKMYDFPIGLVALGLLGLLLVVGAFGFMNKRNRT